MLPETAWRERRLRTLGAGLGWGNIPAHLVADDIARGRLKVIRPAEFDISTGKLVMSGAYPAGRRLGRAGQWMVDYLSALTEDEGTSL